MNVPFHGGTDNLSATCEEYCTAQTEQIEPLHKHESKFFHFDETGVPLVVLTCILLMGLVKYFLALFKRVPHSVLLLVFGFLMGTLTRKFFGFQWILLPEWFFYYMLPPVVLEASLSMKTKEFFKNAGTITVFAVLGTAFNVAATSLTLYYFKSWFSVELSFLEILVFATLISAVDPVAVLCVFEDIQVNELLHICVFGESLLNDAVTIVMYNTAMGMVTPQTTDLAIAVGLTDLHPDPDLSQYVDALIEFFKVSIGGIGCGVVGGLITAMCMRAYVGHQVVQPFIILFIPTICYLFTESMHLSAILALVTCGVIFKNYMEGNVGDEMNFLVECVLKMLASCSENLVFVFLGTSAVSANHVVDWPFIIITLVSCFLYRFISIFGLSKLSNLVRPAGEQICIVDQFVMAYGGIRGAVCYGLVTTIPSGIIAGKDMFVTTTIIVITFTTIGQGLTIKNVVDWLKVKRSKTYGKENEQRTVFEYLTGEVNKHVIHFLEGVTELHQQNFVFRKFLDLDKKYLKPLLIANYNERNPGIITHHQNMEIEEFAITIKGRGGSFAGLPTIPSVGHLDHGLRTSKSEAVLLPRLHDTYAVSSMFLRMLEGHKAGVSLPAPGASSGVTGSPEPSERSQLLAPPPSQRSMTRTESVTHFVREAFEAIRNPRDKRRSLYSRHLLQISPPSPAAFDAGEQETVDENTHVLTYPYCRQGGRKLANNIKQYGRSLRGEHSPPPPKGGTPKRLSVAGPFRQPPSSARATAPPRPRYSLPTPDEILLKDKKEKKPHVPKVQFSTEDETVGAPEEQQSSARQNRRSERVVTSGGKTFFVGSELEEHELGTISEEKLPEFLTRKRERTYSSIQ